MFFDHWVWLIGVTVLAFQPLNGYPAPPTPYYSLCSESHLKWAGLQPVSVFCLLLFIPVKPLTKLWISLSNSGSVQGKFCDINIDCFLLCPHEGEAWSNMSTVLSNNLCRLHNLCSVSANKVLLIWCHIVPHNITHIQLLSSLWLPHPTRCVCLFSHIFINCRKLRRRKKLDKLKYSGCC